MRLSLIFVGLIFIASTVQPKSLRSRIIKMKIKTPALEVSHEKWKAWKENLLTYIAFQIERALSKKMERNPNLGKTSVLPVLPVLPVAAALIQPINEDLDKPQTRKSNISNKWTMIFNKTHFFSFSLVTLIPCTN